MARFSYSICHEYWQGHIDSALAMLHGEQINHPLDIEKAFSFGQGFHKALELEIIKTKRLPAMFGLQDFDVIATEKKLEKKLPIGDDSVLVGVLDCVAINKKKNIVAIIDFKTGTGFDVLQAYTYHYLVNEHPWWQENVGASPTHFMFLTMDKKTDKTANHILHLTVPASEQENLIPTATTLTHGRDWIMTVASELHQQLAFTS